MGSWPGCFFSGWGWALDGPKPAVALLRSLPGWLVARVRRPFGVPLGSPGFRRVPDLDEPNAEVAWNQALLGFVLRYSIRARGCLKRALALREPDRDVGWPAQGLALPPGAGDRVPAGAGAVSG